MNGKGRGKWELNFLVLLQLFFISSFLIPASLESKLLTYFNYVTNYQLFRVEEFIGYALRKCETCNYDKVLQYIRGGENHIRKSVEHLN